MLVVADLAISKQFYVEVLGLKIQSEYPDRVYFTLGAHPIAMFQGEGPAKPVKHAEDANSTLVFSTKNLDEKIAQMKSQGVEFLDETPNSQPWGRYLAFKDPSGIVHEVFELDSEEQTQD
jgi:glyoxylase I family protein